VTGFCGHGNEFSSAITGVKFDPLSGYHLLKKGSASVYWFRLRTRPKRSIPKAEHEADVLKVEIFYDVRLCRNRPTQIPVRLPVALCTSLQCSHYAK
jgi:hypothetical protein